MISVTAKELKNETGKVLRMIKSGQKVIITKRNKPCALLSPLTQDDLEKSDLRPYEQAWPDIEATLKKTKPRFKTVEEAMKWSRKRQ